MRFIGGIGNFGAFPQYLHTANKQWLRPKALPLESDKQLESNQALIIVVFSAAIIPRQEKW